MYIPMHVIHNTILFADVKNNFPSNTKQELNMKSILCILFVLTTAILACPCSGVSHNTFTSGYQHCDCNYLPESDSEYVSPAQDTIDHQHILDAKQAGLNNPSKPFGAVIVDHTTNTVLCAGWNNRTIRYDNHAERDVIDRCTSLYFPNGPNGANHPGWANVTLYSNIESCPMCMASILNRGITRVVYGASLEGYAALCYTTAMLTAKEYADQATTGGFYPQPNTPLQVRGPLEDLQGLMWEPFPTRCV